MVVGVKPALFDAERKKRWTGSRALVLLDTSTCPLCDAELEEVESHQPALLRHAGYGATVRTLHRFCLPCRWGYEAERQEVRPVA